MMKNKFIIALFILGLVSCGQPRNTQEEKELTYQQKLAYAYGISAFDNLSMLSYTFHVKKGDREAERHWRWEPKTGSVTLIEKGDTIAFNHNHVTEDVKEADYKFINDKYWLLFPFQLVWDNGYTSELAENVEAPISKAKLNRFTIQYNNEDGYTPGDAYDFYVNKDLEIKEWTYRKGGQKEPSLTTTWEDYETFHGIKVATNHQSEDGSFRLWFTGVQMN